jgi:hypothetical protein
MFEGFHTAQSARRVAPQVDVRERPGRPPDRFEVETVSLKEARAAPQAWPGPVRFQPGR